jgi:tetratricopeptide (TPR) repeat protein
VTRACFSDNLKRMADAQSPPPRENSPPSSAAPEADGLAHTRLLQEDLLARIEARLAAVPDAVELQVERAHLLAELKRPQEAALVYRKATQSRAPKYPLTSRAYSILPYTGKTLPITVLLLVAPEWGNAPFRKYLNDQIFLTLQIITDFHDPGLSLPPHQLVINCISDAESCPSSLKAAVELLTQTQAPVINPPAQVLATDRESIAHRLASIPGVRTPRIMTFPREFFVAGNIGASLEPCGFSFPLLLRSPGFHTGLHFVRVETSEELIAALPHLPGHTLSVIEFLEARSPDGAIRKYRVMLVDGKLYPAHAAISKDWKVHYFSAAMADFPEHRAEDQSFLEDMPRVLGARVMETLGRIRDELKLDYAGVDFSVGPDGKILLFEANATMNVQPPDKDEMWSYRRGPVQRITDAVRTMFFHRAFFGQSSTTTSPTDVLREFTLRQIEERLAREPELVELNIERGRLLIEMGRLDEAKEIYLAILTKNPGHVIALNNLGTLLNMMGYHEAALKVFREVVNLVPDNAKARVNLAHSLRESGELEEARGQYETVLRLIPDQAEAHLGLSYVLMYLGETDAAWEHQNKGAGNQAPAIFPHREKTDLTPVIILAAPCGGNSPVVRLLDQKTFATLRIIPDFHPPSTPLPPHQLVINAIGDADHCGTSLQAAERILEQTTGPVLNLPARIRTTGRNDNACLLGVLEGVVTPKIATLPREILAGADAISVLETQGFTFPLLLRSPGFHGGSHFLRVEKTDELAAAVAQLPGRKLMAIQYLDARDDDGKIRKYRVMMIDGKLYPLHKAISQGWMIHYFSAEMTHSAAHRAEDSAFLEDMPGVLGPRAMQALAGIHDALGLDYGGADFSLGRNGEVLLFEANATMAVPLPDKGALWDYRRNPVQRIHAAAREMILARARVCLSSIDNPRMDNPGT